MHTPARQLSSNEITQCNNACADEVPSAYRLHPASSNYNCHSYAWYHASTDNPYWLDDITPFANDSFFEKIYLSEATVGDIIVYKNSLGTYTHSAIISSLEDDPIAGTVVTCKSKWGVSGVYIHDAERVPATYYAGLDHVAYDIIRPRHTYSRVLSYTSTTHTQQCMYCTKTAMFSHHYNALSVCTVCSYKSSGPGVLDSILPEEDHLCG